jgi:hypothetical protein
MRDVPPAGRFGPLALSRAAVRATAAAAMLLLVACGDSAAPDPIASIQVQPAADTLRVGETRTLTTVVTTAGGATVTPPMAWTSTDTAIARVSDAGVVTGVNVGNVTIRAAAGGQQGQAQLHVLPELATAVIIQTTAPLVLGEQESRTLQAEARNQAGQPAVGAQLAFASRDTSVATVTAAGTVTARAPGETWVVASADAVRDSIRVQVTVVGLGPDRLRLHVRGAFTGQVTGRAEGLQVDYYGERGGHVAIVTAVGEGAAQGQGVATLILPGRLAPGAWTSFGTDPTPLQGEPEPVLTATQPVIGIAMETPAGRRIFVVTGGTVEVLAADPVTIPGATGSVHLRLGVTAAVHTVNQLTGAFTPTGQTVTIHGDIRAPVVLEAYGDAFLRLTGAPYTGAEFWALALAVAAGGTMQLFAEGTAAPGDLAAVLLAVAPAGIGTVAIDSIAPDDFSAQTGLALLFSDALDAGFLEGYSRGGSVQTTTYTAPAAGVPGRATGTLNIEFDLWRFDFTTNAYVAAGQRITVTGRFTVPVLDGGAGAGAALADGLARTGVPAPGTAGAGAARPADGRLVRPLSAPLHLAPPLARPERR